MNQITNFFILEIIDIYDTILESEHKSKVFYDTFNVPWTNTGILVQNGPKFFLMKNEFYLTGNHWGNIGNINYIKNRPETSKNEGLKKRSVAIKY